MEVEGLAPGKDFKLYPGGGLEWDWSETGTRHNPGIQPQDVEELLDRGATAIVLSLGMQLQLQIDPRTLRSLDERGVVVQSAETTQAVKLYNEPGTTPMRTPASVVAEAGQAGQAALPLTPSHHHSARHLVLPHIEARPTRNEKGSLIDLDHAHAAPQDLIIDPFCLPSVVAALMIKQCGAVHSFPAGVGRATIRPWSLVPR